MVEVNDWLEQIGLGKYAEVFSEQEIDTDVLRALTDGDLEKLGLPLGARKRLLAATARLGPDVSSDPCLVAAIGKPDRKASVKAEPVADRRQLTVLFCDLVGSTELAARLDPEDFRDVISSYHQCVAEALARFEGYVAQFLGDGALAYFGYPSAHEDDPERAVHAGLSLLVAIGRLTPRADLALEVRIGIATGLVVVSDLIGEGERGGRAIGDTPNLAARLQTLAQPGQVVIGESTRRLVNGLFELSDLGPQRVKGLTEPIRAWLVLGPSAVESRFEARQAAGLTPLVGREHELGLLIDRWQLAKEGEGQVALLSGQPGIGKSRILQALREHLSGEPHTPLSHYCSPYHVNSALYPVIALLERAARLTQADPPERQLEKLEGLLALATDDLREVVPRVADLLAIPTAERYPASNLSPQRRKERTLAALVDQLVGLATKQPVLALYEDVHWIDPTSLELLELVVERVQDLPVLVVITFRPEFVAPWSSYAHVTSVSLNRLGRRQVTDMIERITAGKHLPKEVLDQILTKTDGVPLFIEELTKSVLESGLLRDAGDSFELTGQVTPLAIPASLHDSLMARLDRLAPIKEVAQIGAAIGREFSHELLAAVANRPDEQIQAALDELVLSGLVLRRGTPPEASYSFKHVLVQEAAYQSLLKSRRQQLHARIAQALEEGSPYVSETAPEVLARHLTDAGLPQRAIPYWRRAGELAAGHSANLEAIAHLSKGLELIGSLENAAEHLDEELAFRMAIGGPLIATKGYAAPEVGLTYSRASALCEQLGRAAELFPALRGLWHYCHARGELRRAHQLADRLVVLAEEQETPLRRALARRARGAALFLFGQFADAMAALNEGIAFDDPVAAWEDPAHLLLYTERAGVMCRLYSAAALWYLGFPDRALERVEDGLALGQRVAHVHSLAFALIWAARLHNLRREFAAARRRSEATIDLAREHRLPQRLAEATMCRGIALVGLGQRVEGMAELRTGLAGWNATGSRVWDTQWLGFIAEAHLQAGQFDDALTALDRAAETAAATGECHYQAELYRLRGVVLVETGGNAEAVAWLQRAIGTARSQQAKSLELRAATSLARLWRDQGKPAEAHDLLAPVYAWFTEGLDTPDLKDASAMLGALRGQAEAQQHA